ncbi:hypothetical protein GLAREA_04273 [Glarea lozoyensis ATCC 20868]|uniref:Uncharacterized protein n=1 Tax=Glarea lozoyensis (strain ATCC 20868 / MF5171) TaxID=1116229 RepID=S3CLV3_GLAL2|nr:uncharacterized protein GLAREA_04273 [Glarea lozoyensis ATCC 20868]EPE27482.1 hypothetical protein GLAREA_04273 [Glarea lozoyensis ATCC 20868]
MLSLQSLAILGIFLSAVNAGEVLSKREPLLEGRQTICRTPGWVPDCPGLFSCVPPGGICCDDGITYVEAPETCPDGTQAITTARTGSAAPAPTTIPTTITTPPASTQTFAANYVYFTYEITWYYYYYYYTYIQFSTALTSSQVTTITTVSVQATDSAQATLLLSSLSATLAFPTPTQTATAVSGVAPVITPISTGTTTPARNATSAVPTSTPVQFTGGASFGASNSGLWVMTALMVLPGFLMMWL